MEKWDFIKEMTIRELASYYVLDYRNFNHVGLPGDLIRAELNRRGVSMDSIDDRIKAIDLERTNKLNKVIDRIEHVGMVRAAIEDRA